MKTRTMSEIEMTLKPSLVLSGLLVMLTSIGLWVVVVYVSDWRLQLALAVLLLATTIYHVLRDGLLRLPNAWKHLQVSAQGELRLTNRAGQVFTPELADSTWTHPRLTILNFKRTAGHPLWRPGLPPVILMACNDGNCRRLRVWLRWWRHQDVLADKEISA